MSAMLRIISSMAARQVLADLVPVYAQRSRQTIDLVSVGGVDAAKRVRAGEAFDAVVLASDAIDALAEDRHIVAGTRVDLARSMVAVAVRAGAPHPDIGSAEALRQAVLAARSVSYSTGPSGMALARMFEQWGIGAGKGPKLVQAPPGVPVGMLVARGDADLGFQQLSELMHLDGVEVVGSLPAPIAVVTTFSGAVAAVSTCPEETRALLAFLASPAADASKRRHGMESA